MVRNNNKRDDSKGNHLTGLPRQDYYTLEQAANELNIYFNRNNIGEDYFIHLAEVGRIKLFFPIYGVDLLCSLPLNFEEAIQDINTKEKIISDLRSILKSRAYRHFIGLNTQNIMALSTLNELNLCHFMELFVYNFKQSDSLKFTSVSRAVDLPQDLRLMFAFRKPRDGVDSSRVSSFSESEVVDFNQLDTLWDEITLKKNMLCIFDSTLQRIKDGNVPSYYAAIHSEHQHSGSADEVLEEDESSSLDKFNYRKQDLMAMARVMAAYEWSRDLKKGVLMTEMATLIRKQIEPYARSNEIPKTTNTIADWIRSEAPEYAKKGGRPPIKK